MRSTRWNHNGSRAAFVLCLTVLFAGVARAQVSGRVEGTVVGEDGKGLKGVNVQASERATGTRSTTTDKAGRYRFPELRPGSYLATFSLDGYFANQKSAVVRLGGTATVNIKLFREERPTHEPSQRPATEGGGR